MELQATGQRIIVVDDDLYVQEAIEMILAGAGHAVRATASGAEALRWLEEAPYDLLIVDLHMPEMDGPTIYKHVLTRWPAPAPRVLLISGRDDLGTHHDDPTLRGVPVLVKPFNLGDLCLAVDRALAAA